MHLLGYWPLPDALRAALREELGGEALGEREAARPMSVLQLQQETLHWGPTVTAAEDAGGGKAADAGGGKGRVAKGGKGAGGGGGGRVTERPGAMRPVTAPGQSLQVQGLGLGSGLGLG